ncbi:MAG TPA: DUF504 domain-containing protein [Desulfobulbaceae bacterium]|nr:DUF504 domain-containing protein [Desulfobulbaceae bacterium]
MITIDNLLNRIQWDREFGRGDFKLGYYDRILEEIVRVSFSEIIFPAGRRDAIQVLTLDGVIHSIPLHRIKEVYRDNEMIWHREH